MALKPAALTALLQEVAAAPKQLEARLAPLLPGTVVGRLEILREQGRGGFGVVYEAKDRDLGRQAAVKLVRPGRITEEDGRVSREAEAIARLSHPNLITLFEVGRNEHGPVLVFELPRGKTLDLRIEEGHPRATPADRAAPALVHRVAWDSRPSGTAMAGMWSRVRPGRDRTLPRQWVSRYQAATYLEQGTIAIRVGTRVADQAIPSGGLADMTRRPVLATLLAALVTAACGVAATPAAPTVNTPTAPVISSFTATPTSIATGGSSTLGWTVNGATSLSIDQGLGPVTGTSKPVSPTSTTTYTLTASNAAGSSIATATVTVTGGGAVGTCNSTATQLFPPGAPWNQAIDGASLDAESGAIIAYLAANHTAGARFQITFDFNILFADGSTPHRTFTTTGDFFSPDCDPAPVPVPAAGRLEGEGNYACAADGDCHLTVVDRSTCRLHELWRANLAGGTSTGTFTSGCQAIWDLSAVPPATGRGDFCTSADAAGLPILPLVFTADEVASGTIDHALRFILPNSLIRADIYVRPGTHSTGATGGGSAAPPYAARLRLKASKDLSGLSAGARVIALALKKHGMFLADGGNVTFTAATDALTAHTWGSVGVDASSLKSLLWSDFEVVDMGTRIDYGTGSCSRTPITR